MNKYMVEYSTVHSAVVEAKSAEEAVQIAKEVELDWDEGDAYDWAATAIPEE
jgi:hypothetical protein